ncbi:hypothetical protein ACVIQT_007625 [Bradyrhizobium diazoefficiens]
MIRTTLATISALLLLALPAQAADDVIAAPTLRASVTVTSDVVRVGDLIDNAGSAALIPVYRSPDLGTTGALPVAHVLSVLRAKQVIGVMTGDIREVQVTRLARTLANKDLENAVASALERRFGLGDAANITVTFDRGVADMRLDASNTGALQPVATRYDARGGRFDIAFEINNDNNPAPTKLRFTGTAIETVEVAVLTRDIDRADLLKSSDVTLERRPKAEVTRRGRLARPHHRHAAAPADAGGHADPRRGHRQARLRAARPERHHHLPGARALPHHARQGDRERRRG